MNEFNNYVGLHAKNKINKSEGIIFINRVGNYCYSDMVYISMAELLKHSWVEGIEQ